MTGVLPLGRATRLSGAPFGMLKKGVAGRGAAARFWRAAKLAGAAMHICKKPVSRVRRAKDFILEELAGED